MVELWLKARIRPRDHDIKEALESRQFAQGEISEMIRDGFRMVLFGNATRPTEDLVFSELKEKDPDILDSDIEALVDNLIKF
jgi:hypothetical protein